MTYLSKLEIQSPHSLQPHPSIWQQILVEEPKNNMTDNEITTKLYGYEGPGGIRKHFPLVFQDSRSPIDAQ